MDQVSCFRSPWGCLYIFSESFCISEPFRSRLWKDRVYHLAESFSILEPNIKQKIRQQGSPAWSADSKNRYQDWEHRPFQKSMEQWPASRKMQHGGLGTLWWKTGGVLPAEVWLSGLSRRDCGITRKTQESRHQNSSGSCGGERVF